MREYLSLNDLNLPLEQEEDEDSNHEGSLASTISVHDLDHGDLFSDSSNDGFPELDHLVPRRRSPNLLEGLVLDHPDARQNPSPCPVEIQRSRYVVGSQILDFTYFYRNKDLSPFNGLKYLNDRFNDAVYMNKPMLSIENDPTSEMLPLSIFFNPFDYELAMSRFVTKLECLEISCLEFYW